MARILIVEDDRPFADVLAITFRLEGYEVMFADSAEEGVRIGLARRPDVVIADWKLRSEMHGDEVCRRIRAVCPHARTIVITGYSDVAARIDCHGKDVDAVLEKPFHTQEIIDAVNQSLLGVVVSLEESSLALAPAPVSG